MTEIKEIVLQILGNSLVGNRIPTKILFEKSGLGNSNIPPNNPTTIEI